MSKNKKLTFKEFKKAYKSGFVSEIPLWRKLFVAYDEITFEPHYRIPNIYVIGFVFHFRVPGKDGHFIKDGNWCFPWNWYRQYYEKRYL